MQERSWYVLEGQESVGPLSELALLRGHFSSRYPADTMVRESADANWVALETALPLQHYTPPPVPEGRQAAIRHAGAWINSGPYPWRRYFARQLDLLIGAFLMSAMLAAILSFNDAAYTAYLGFMNSGNRIVLNIVAVLLAFIPNGILIGATGTSIGKLIFGLRVLNLDQQAPGILRGLRREFQLTFQGLGAGVPIITLITLIWNFSRLNSDGVTPWDADNALTTWYRAPSYAHAALMVLGILLWLACTLAVLAAMAPDA